MSEKNLKLSTLPHTWIFDLDGTLVVHNGYKFGGDKLLDGVKEFFDSIPPEDFILILTAREKIYEAETLDFLKFVGLRFDKIIFDMPNGERILLNDNKPNGLLTSHSINLQRDEGFGKLTFTIDETL